MRAPGRRMLAARRSIVAPWLPDDGSAKDFCGGNLCLLDRLANTTLDASLGFCESCAVRLVQRSDGTVSIAAEDGDGDVASDAGVAIPLGHQWHL